jgi:hypothetical protein
MQKQGRGLNALLCAALLALLLFGHRSLVHIPIVQLGQVDPRRDYQDYFLT